MLNKSIGSKFGKVFLTALFALLLTGFFGVSGNAQSVSKVGATFEKAWVDYDITEGGKKGMRIHVKFNVRGLKYADAAVRIYFETGDGKRLRDKNKSYYSKGGDVALFRNLKIDYDPGYYEDLTMFMPYDELDLDAGEYDLKMDIDLIYQNGDLIQHLAFHDFVFTQPETDDVDEAPMPNIINKTAEPAFFFDKAWIDYDVTEGGRKGMRIHVKFSVENMRGVDSELGIRVMRQSGEFLKNSNYGYTNKSGELYVVRKLRPGFDVTNYEDEKIFLPYDQLKNGLGRGSFNLSLDFDINKPNGDLIKHIGTYNFVFKSGVE